MKHICQRMPTLAEKVLKNLNNQDLIKFKESNREINSFLNEERFFSMRIINAHFGNFIKFQDSWNKVINKASKEMVKQLAAAIQKFFVEDKSRFAKQWPPFWIAAEIGSTQLCKYIIEKTGETSPDGDFGLNAALFMSAKKGHKKVCKFIGKSNF